MDQPSHPADTKARSAPAPARSSARTAPAPAQTQTRRAPLQTRERPAAPPSLTATPSLGQPAVTGTPPENLGIDPIPSPNNDRSIGFDWESALLGTNRSLQCTVTSSDDHILAVTIDQAAYQRSMQGEGVVKIGPIAVAPNGTRGKLTARDTATGATATLSWQWHPRSSGGGAAPPPKARGFLRRLFSSRPQTGAAQVRSRLNAAPSLAQRLGARAASAVTMTFFGQEAVGQRFAFILDMSGSMRGERWTACVSECERALRNLPERVEFFIILFTGEYEPPGQTGWTRAEPGRIEAAISWIKNVRPTGGTFPAAAFKRVFSLPESADIIHFLTDGELYEFSPMDCAEIRGSKPTLINTITLGNKASAGDLEAMAADSGGRYIHVPVPGSR